MSYMEKKFAMLCSALLAVSVMLSGCNLGGGGSSEKSAGNDVSRPKEKFNLTVMRSEHPSQPQSTDSPVLKQLEKVYGVNIDLQTTPSSDYDTKKQTLISTNHIPDVIFVTLKDFQDYAKTGIFLDLTPYMDKTPNLKKALEKFPDYKRILVNDKLYGFPNLDRENSYYAQRAMIRTDILRDLNLPMPGTFDELYQTLKKMKAVYPDSYPWTMRNGITGNLSYLGYSFGTGYTIYYDPAKDKYQYGPLYPEFKNLMAYLKKMYDEKLLDPNYAKNTAQQWQQNLSSGKSLFMFDNDQFTVNFNQVLQRTNPNAKFDIMPILKNDSGQRRNYRYPDGHPTNFYAISSKVKNPEQIVKFLDWLYTEEGADITNYGVEGEHYSRTKDGVKINPEFMAKFKDKQEQAWSMLSYLGAGFQGFSLYSDQTVFDIVDPQMAAWAEFIKKESEQGLVQQIPIDPPFNPEELEKLKQLRTSVGTIVSQNLDKFIMGDRPIGNYDVFVKELTDAGAKEIENIYNAAYDRLKANK